MMKYVAKIDLQMGSTNECSLINSMHTYVVMD